MTPLPIRRLGRIAAALATALVILAGCGFGNSPASAYKRFLAALQRGDISTATQFLDPQQMAKMNAAGMDPSMAMKFAVEGAKQKGGIKSYEVVDEPGAAADSAFVRATVHFGDGTSDAGRRHLVKSSDGQWHMAMQ